MPIYEFYCPDCHTVFNFLARSPKARRRPACPRCARPKLERRASRFAISKGLTDEGPADPFDGVDESRLERAMAELAGQAEGMDDGDPRQVARMMRQVFDATGMPVPEAMQEAIRRMEAGEDPDRIEEDMGDRLDDADEAMLGAARGEGLRRLRHRLPPRTDPTLYEL